MARLKIRQAELEDIEALLELEQLFPGDRMGRGSFRHLFKAGKAVIWLAQSKGRMVADAVVFYRKNAKRARLYSLIVHPDVRGQGVGTKLLSHAETSAKQQGYQGMRLEVREDNKAAIHLYEQAGYQIKALVKDYYDDHCGALKMQKGF